MVVCRSEKPSNRMCDTTELSIYQLLPELRVRRFQRIEFTPKREHRRERGSYRPGAG